MSYYVTLENFRTWLNRAQCALVSKNKVRKDLWTDFCDLLMFENPDDLNVIKISQSHYTTISTFLQTEGRSDSLKDDSILNWVTTLHDLRRQLNDEFRYTARTRASSEEERKHPTSVPPAPSSTTTETIEDPLRSMKARI